jgi:hypothetical protein
MSITGIVVGSIFFLLGAIAVIIGIVRQQPGDDNVRTRELVKLAQVCYPQLSLTDALDKLYELTYKNLVRTKRQGGNIRKLIHDQTLIANERLRIWREQAEQNVARIEGESHFKIIQGKPTPRKPPQPA